MNDPPPTCKPPIREIPFNFRTPPPKKSIETLTYGPTLFRDIEYTLLKSPSPKKKQRIAMVQIHQLTKMHCVFSVCRHCVRALYHCTVLCCVAMAPQRVTHLVEAPDDEELLLLRKLRPLPRGPTHADARGREWEGCTTGTGG